MLHGDRGCRWNQRPQGRIWALLPLACQALERADAARAAKGLPRYELPPAERVAVLATASPRLPWLDAVMNQAEGLQRAAGKAWKLALAEAS